MSSNKALLVLGMSRAVLDPDAAAPILEIPMLLEAVRGEIDYFRERRRPVIFLIPAAEGTPAQELIDQVHPDLRADPLDTILPLPSLSAFQRSGLDSWLAAHPLELVTLVGVRTSTEVLFTAADACMRGLRFIVPAPCVSTLSAEEHECGLRLLRNLLKPQTLHDRVTGKIPEDDPRSRLVTPR